MHFLIWQGGGLLILYGQASLTNCNIHSNTANTVLPAFLIDLPGTFLQRPAGTLHFLLWQGGGLFISAEPQLGGGGEANVTNCDIFDNTATTFVLLAF